MNWPVFPKAQEKNRNSYSINKQVSNSFFFFGIWFNFVSKKNENKGNHPLWASFVVSYLRSSLFTVNQFCFKFFLKYFYLIFYIIIKDILNMRKDFCQIFKLNYLYNFMILHRSTVIYSFSFFLFFFSNI
jgi:hypothetical protein